MVHPSTARTFFFIFAAVICLFYLPSIFRRPVDRNVNQADNGGQRVLSFVCTTERPTIAIPMNGARHRLAVQSGATVDSLERTLAAACGWNPPVLVYNIEAGMVMLNADLPTGDYYVYKPTEKTDNSANVLARQKWEQEMRSKIEAEVRREIETELYQSRNTDNDNTGRPPQTIKKVAPKVLTNKEKRDAYNERVARRQSVERAKYEERISKRYKQISPPASDAKLIYPNPMRHPSAIEGNITFVTAAINIKRKAHAGKAEHEYKFEDDYLEILKILLSWHRPLQLIMQRKYYEMLASQGVIHDQAIIRIVETDDLRAWKYYEPIEKIRKTDQWQQIASWLPESPQGYNDLYNPLIMNKIFWMKDLCHQNPYNTKYFMWVDCGVCTTYVSGDMVEFLAPRYENMMAPGFLATNSPRDGGHEIQGFLRWKLEEMAGTHTTHMMKGGTFGGTCEQIDKFVAEYDRVLAESLAEGFLGTEESLFTIVFYRLRDMFHEFRQERPESIGEEALCLMNDRFYHLPEFGEKYVEGVGESYLHE
eukprot:TRINITY_DN228_c1_g1_i1.p1 TRINITY_DN228_c1_g1~~TRINITY_DN228_c1_g1_i1.p1  ORF type:complete len:536 (+),score=93.03 TRINITY_DN228_c1_g1_i1:183-1790(+)